MGEGWEAYRDRLPPQNDEAFRSDHHEPRELVAQDLLDFIGLLDLDAHSDGIDGRFDQDAFIGRS